MSKKIILSKDDFYFDKDDSDINSEFLLSEELLNIEIKSEGK